MDLKSRWLASQVTLGSVRLGVGRHVAHLWHQMTARGPCGTTSVSGSDVGGHNHLFSVGYMIVRDKKLAGLSFRPWYVPGLAVGQFQGRSRVTKRGLIFGRSPPPGDEAPSVVDLVMSVCLNVC